MYETLNRKRAIEKLKINYILTSWSRVLLKMLTGSQSRNSPHFMEPGGSLLHLQEPTTCPYPEPHQSRLCSPSQFLQSILILSSHLHLDLQSSLLPSGFPTKTLYKHLPSPTGATCPTHLILLDFIYDMIYICSLQLGSHLVAVVQYTFTHKKYTEQHKTNNT